MKIIFGIDYISRKNTGISSLVENLTINFLKKDHEIFIATIEDNFTSIDKVNFKGAKTLIVKKKWYPFNIYKIFKEYFNFFIDSNADIAHVHSLWSISSIAVFYWSYKTKKPYLISTNGMLNEWALSQSKVKKKLFLSIIFKKIIDNAKMIIVNSTVEKSYLIENGWHSCFSIIPNGVAIENLKNNHFLKKSKKKKLLFLSRIHKKKGIDILLDAWKELFELTVQEKWELAIIGFMDSLNMSEYEKYIDNKINSDSRLSNVSVSDAKFGAEMWKEYESSDAFILPTFSEGSSLAVLNAWTAGKICLTTPGSNLEFGLNDNCTILIDPNKKSIKEGILKLIYLTDEELFEFGKTGKKIILENYTWEKISEMYINVYENIIDHYK